MSYVKMPCPNCGHPADVNVGLGPTKSGETPIYVEVLSSSEECRGCGAFLKVKQEGTLNLSFAKR